MRAFLIAGEASGDKLGAALMAGLKSQIDIEFQGVGGPLMQAEGMQSLFPMEELSVMGLAEVLPKYPHLKRRLNQTAEAVLSAQPDVLITIDSPDFCLRVARLVKEKNLIRTVHYVAPSVWAWRAGRAVKMARVIDHVLALLPFEPPYMEAAGIVCDFVGHPVVNDTPPTKEQLIEFKEKYELPDAPLLLVLPGSRRSEVARLGPRFGEALGPVMMRYPELNVVIPTTANVTGMVLEMVQNWPVSPLVLDPRNTGTSEYRIEKAASFYAADWALATSGTVSLELAAAQTPMVIAYDASLITRTIMQKMLQIDTLTLVNLITDSRVIPECLGREATPANISDKLLKLMENPDSQLAAMQVTMERLGKGGEAPGLRAAKAVLRRMPGAERSRL